VTDGPPFDARRAIVVVVIAAGLVVSAGVAAFRLAGDVPRDVRVLGADLGGMSRTAAEQALHEHVDGQAADPVRVRLDGQPVRLDPAAVGIRLDVDATVGRAIRTGARDVVPVVRLDLERLEAELRRRIPAERITLRRPGITFRGLTAVPAYPGTGLDLDPEKAGEAVKLAWPIGATAEVPLVRRTPHTTRAQVDALIARLARPAVSAPVDVTIGSGGFELTPRAIAAGLVFRSDSAGRLTPALDGARLHEAAADGFARVENSPEPARLVLRADRPRVLPGLAGMVVDLRQLGPDLLAVLTEPAPRTVTASLTRVAATSNDLDRLGIREQVATFGTPAGDDRNAAAVATAVDGTILRPGETFSLNAHTGPRSSSQFATALFDAAYYAGLQDVEHTPHTSWSGRYPAVIESAIAYPARDLKFRNTTPYGIWIHAAVTDGWVRVSLWSTRVYDSVRTEYGPRRSHRPACGTSSGLPGFTQDAWRVIRKDGWEIERQKFSWRYDPVPQRVCGAMP
jgi:hypothetical protein